MNRIRTHTLIFPACLCLAPSYSQESHLRKTGWDIPALLSRFWQGAHTHTHTERETLKGFRAQLRWNAHKHTLWAATHRPTGRLGKTTASVCVFWVQQKVVMTWRRKKTGHLYCVLCQTTWVICSAETFKCPQDSGAGGCGASVLFHKQIISADLSTSLYSRKRLRGDEVLSNTQRE